MTVADEINAALILVEMDELLDPFESGPRSAKPGTPYYKVSIRAPGQGVGETFVTEPVYRQLARMGLGRGDAFYLVFTLYKRQGMLEPRLTGVQAA